MYLVQIYVKGQNNGNEAPEKFKFLYHTLAGVKNWEKRNATFWGIRK